MRELHRTARNIAMRALIFDAAGFVQTLRRLGDAPAVGENLSGFDGLLRFGARFGIAVLDQKHIGAIGRRRHDRRQALSRAASASFSRPKALSAVATMDRASRWAAAYIFSGVS